METLPVLQMVKRELQRKSIRISDLSRGLKLNSSSVTGMLQRPTMHVQRLAELSEFLNYNFFREIAAKLPYSEPDYTDANSKAEVNGLQTRIKELELEVSILRQTLKDLVSR
jgi:hypothetical protein